jgi:hypothetical protein
MIRLKQRQNAKAKTKKDEVRSNFSKKLVLLITMMFAAMLVFGAQETKGQNNSPKQEQINALYTSSVKYHKKAKYWTNKRGATFRPKKITPKKNSAGYETYRNKLWKRKSQAAYKKYVLHKKSHKIDIRKCVRTGFPRWYCPILLDVSTKMKKKSWAWNPSLHFIIQHESGFNPKADNPTSTAYGLFQMLVETSPNPRVQTVNGLRYISGRYGTPENAEAFWQNNHWY